MIQTFQALCCVLREGRLDSTSITNLQQTRLKRILCSAYDHVPYYHELMREAVYNPHSDFRDSADLRRLRITSRHDVKQNPIERLVDNRRLTSLQDVYRDRTSGTTGSPTVVYRSKTERALQIAKWLRVLFYNGYSPFDKTASFTIPARINHGRSIIQHFGLFRRLPIDLNAPPAETVDLMLAYQPQIVYGNRSYFDLVCDELKRRNKSIGSVKLVLTGGEAIGIRSRKLCQDTLTVDMTGFYGSVEVGVMALQSTPGGPYHLCEDRTLFEFLDASGNPSTLGERSRVVVTDLSRTLMPFIRYDHGDTVVHGLSDDGTRRVIQDIVGRDDDFAVLPDGSRRSFFDFYQVVDVFENIRLCRIIQKELHRFHVKIVADRAYFDLIHDDLLARFNQICSDTVTFHIHCVASLPPDPGGKIRLLISEVDRP